MINALRPKYSLKQLLEVLDISKSSYFYQTTSLQRPNKYKEIRVLLKEIFLKSNSIYGYRRMKKALIDYGFNISEKVIRRLMKEENLIAKNRA